MPNKSIKPPATSDNGFNPRLDYFNNPKLIVKFEGSCLNPNRVTFAPNIVINLYFTLEIKPWPCSADNRFTLRNFLSGAVKLIKNTDSDKSPYTGYGISFDARGTFSLSNDEFGKKVVIFGADMS